MDGDTQNSIVAANENDGVDGSNRRSIRSERRTIEDRRQSTDFWSGEDQRKEEDRRDIVGRRQTAAWRKALL